MKSAALPFVPYLAMILGLYVCQSAWAAFVFYHGLILVSLISAQDCLLWRELTTGWSWRTGLAAILFGIAGGVVLYLLAPLAGVNKTTIDPALTRLGLQGVWWLLFVCYHALVNPWLEELLWRGKLGSKSKRLVFNDVLFAGYHVLVLVLFLDWVWILPAFGLLTLAGWLWRQLRCYNNGLLLPVVSHLAADASIMAVVYAISR